MTERPAAPDRGAYPFSTRDLDLPSGTATIVDEGEGPTLLFVHAGFWSFVWRDVICDLRSDFRCIAVDFPGFGLAPDAPGPPTLSDLSTTLGEAVGELGIERFTLVAHDLGGAVGLRTAADQPDRIEGLVLANTFAWEPDTAGLRLMLRTVGSGWLRAIDVATGFVPRLSATGFGVGRHLEWSERRAFLTPFADRQRIGRFHDLIRSALSSPDHFAAVAAATAGPLRNRPVLTIFGERNDPFGFQRRLHELFPQHGEGVVVARGNHFPMMDDPQLFARSVRSWHAGAFGRRTES
jgi:haloalkane dehalogenase